MPNTIHVASSTAGYYSGIDSEALMASSMRRETDRLIMDELTRRPPTFTSTQSTWRPYIGIDPESLSDDQKKSLKHHGWVSPEEFEAFKSKYGLDKIT